MDAVAFWTAIGSLAAVASAVIAYLALRAQQPSKPTDHSLLSTAREPIQVSAPAVPNVMSFQPASGERVQQAAPEPPQDANPPPTDNPHSITPPKEEQAPTPAPPPESGSDPLPSEKDYLIREKTAREVLAVIFETKREYDQSQSFRDLFEGKWVKWSGRLAEKPWRSGEDWACAVQEDGTYERIIAVTSANMSTLRPGDSVEIEGRIDDCAGRGFDERRRGIHLRPATVTRRAPSDG